MSTEFEEKPIATLRVVRDCDTEMAAVGDIDGGFHPEALERYLRAMGTRGYQKLNHAIMWMRQELDNAYIVDHLRREEESKKTMDIPPVTRQDLERFSEELKQLRAELQVKESKEEG